MVQTVLLNGDPHLLRSQLADFNIVGVVHLASEYVKDHSVESVSALINANIAFGAQILEATSADAQWFLNVGSIWQHHHGQMDTAANLYAATKNAFEQLLAFYSNSASISAMSVYIGDTYGPGDSRPKILNLWRDSALQGSRVKMSPGFQKLSILHVDDVVDALVKAIGLLSARPDAASQRFQRFVIDSDKYVNLRDLATLFGKATGLNLKVEWGASPYRKREVMDPTVPFQRLPGWSPRKTLEDGLREVFGFCAPSENFLSE